LSLSRSERKDFLWRRGVRSPGGALARVAVATCPRTAPMASSWV
jgi:hypothetical protein